MSGERSCDLCGRRARKHVYDVNGYSIVECADCGLVFVDSEVGPEELVSLYDRSYYEAEDAVGYGGYAEAEARKRHHDRTLLDEIEKRGTRGDLLEIGCAYGYFLDEARKRGWSVRGVEPSTHAARFAREQLDLDVRTAAFTDIDVDRESVDAIALWDVIEHLSNPRETIEYAGAWLRPGGVLAISTGDVKSLSARLQGADWSLMTPPWHQFYFSRKTLTSMLERTGFRVLKIGGDGNVAIDRASARPRINGALASAMRHPMVTTIARKLGAGSIMYVYARKAQR
jgi:SAM-dependent methyltransferase